MSPNGRSNEHYAKIRRQVVLHRMATASCLGDRLFWLIILWSWCGPECTDDGRVVKKDDKGFIIRERVPGTGNTQGREIPARAVDLRKQLGLPESMRSHVSEELNRLVAQNSIVFRDGIIYANASPRLPDPPQNVPGTGNILSFYIGRKCISTGNIPTDPEARERAVQWLEQTAKSFNQELKALRTRYNEILVQAAPGLGIIIEEEKKRRRETTTTTEAAPELVPDVVADSLLAVLDEPEEDAEVVPQSSLEPELSPVPMVVPETATTPTVVLEELRTHGVVTPETASKLVGDCRSKFPEATEEEVVGAMRKIAGGFTRSVRNPVGVLLTQTPQFFATYQRPQPPPPAPDVGERERQMARRFLEADDGDVPEDQKQWARGVLYDRG